MKAVSFWGKGGVGKSTMAAASAVYLAARGLRVHLISTDYTPSLGFLLGLRGEEGVLLQGRLMVSQLSEDKIVELWRERFGEEVYRVAASIFPVGREVIDYVARAPGIVEEFALYYVYEQARRGGFDVMLWDTMAAGGGIRMVKVEKEFYSHLNDAVKMYLKVKGVVDKVRRGGPSPLELIEEWRRIAEDILSFLGSPRHRAVLVARPYPLDLDVAVRINRELEELGVKIRGTIVNTANNGEACRMLPQPCCPVPQLSEPPRGAEALLRLASETCLGGFIEKMVES